MSERLRPDRVIPFTFDVLSAEVARQCIAEWQAWADYEMGDRAGAIDRLAILIDLGRQQAAIELERRTGIPAVRWSPARNRASLAATLSGALPQIGDEHAGSISARTITRIRVEVETPWTQYVAQGNVRQ